MALVQSSDCFVSVYLFNNARKVMRSKCHPSATWLFSWAGYPRSEL